MAGFKALVEADNKRRFSWPAGWSDRETVAADIGCQPDSVGEILSPLIKSGAVEMQWFKVWRDGRFVKLQGFREKSKETKGSK